MESRCRDIEFVELGEALGRLGIDPSNIHATLIDLGGYRGRPDWERLFLALVARSCGKRACFEIGTASGNTTVLLAANLEGTVYTLDLPDSDDWQPTLTRLGSDDVVRASRKRAEFIVKHPKPNIVDLVGDSARFDYSPYHGRIGLFFVDGAHSLEYVRSDTMNAAWCCQDDAVVIWDALHHDPGCDQLHPGAQDGRGERVRTSRHATRLYAGYRSASRYRTRPEAWTRSRRQIARSTAARL